MQITKGELKQIIAEELEKIESQEHELDGLMNEYIDIYSSDDDTVTVDSVVDFLEALNEEQIPKSALYAFLSALPQNNVKGILKEALEE
jgi:hypothetical protein